MNSIVIRDGAPAVLDSALRKAARRLLPFLGLLFFVCYLDRVNVGFAAVTMNGDLGLSATAFGLGSGIFFLGYVLFEVPSNLALRRFGARRWIARILFTWGLASGAMAFVEDTTSFLIIRFLLGVAEAGFVPGVLLYLTFWFPARQRAQLCGLWLLALPLSGIVGPPVSGLLFLLDGLGGFQDWQIMFLVEAIPPLLLTFVTLAYLPDSPAEARWLTPEERAALQREMGLEEAHRRSLHPLTLGQGLLLGRVWLLGLIALGPVIGIYGINLWLPQILQGLGIADPLSIGLLAALPSIAALGTMIYWPRRSDRKGERIGHAVAAMLVGAAGLLLSAYLTSPAMALLCLAVAMGGLCAFVPIFWTLPTAFLSGSAAAAGIALVNSIANLGGYIGPQIIGLTKDEAGHIGPAMILFAGLIVLAALGLRLLGHDPRLERRPEAEVTEAPV